MLLRYDFWVDREGLGTCITKYGAQSRVVYDPSRFGHANRGRGNRGVAVRSVEDDDW